jgi:hypothetical protein
MPSGHHLLDLETRDVGKPAHWHHNLLVFKCEITTYRHEGWNESFYNATAGYAVVTDCVEATQGCQRREGLLQRH